MLPTAQCAITAAPEQVRGVYLAQCHTTAHPSFVGRERAAICGEIWERVHLLLADRLRRLHQKREEQQSRKMLQPGADRCLNLICFELHVCDHLLDHNCLWLSCCMMFFCCRLVRRILFAWARILF